MDDILKVLRSLGLNEKECRVYLTLLQVGTSSASMIERKTGIIRSTAQYTCQQLVKKLLATKTIKGNVFFFTAEPPEKLSSLLARAKQDLTQREQQLGSVIKKLGSFMQPFFKLPKMQFFEGTKGIAEGYRQVISELKDKEELISYIAPIDQINTPAGFKITEADLRESMTYFDKERARIGSPMRLLTLPSPEAINMQKDDAKMLREIRIVDQLPLEQNGPAEVIIFGNNMFFSTVEKGVILAAILQNTNFANLHRSLFELAWKAAAKK